MSLNDLQMYGIVDWLNLGEGSEGLGRPRKGCEYVTTCFVFVTCVVIICQEKNKKKPPKVLFFVIFVVAVDVAVFIDVVAVVVALAPHGQTKSLPCSIGYRPLRVRCPATSMEKRWPRAIDG